MTSEISRRDLLCRQALGLGGVAVASMLSALPGSAAPPEIAAARRTFDMLPKTPPAPARATAMISLFMHGGPSHMDLLDPRPELTKYSGTEYQGEVTYSFVNRASKKLLGSPWRFRPHGQCGTEVSELLPHTAGIVDELCVIRSMHTGFNGHEVSIRYLNAGIPAVTGRPSLGSWVSYALGTENQNLPAYMVLTDPGGHPVDGVLNWSGGWMPAMFQGTVLRPQEPRILNLAPPAHLAGVPQRQNLNLLNSLNRLHQQKYPGESDLEARIASWELAARMQVAASEALDLSQETLATQQMYGLDQPETREYGTRCLLARRLVERGVRFVQLFLDGQPWDNHSSIRTTLPAACRRTDQPSAALVRDLRQRGLLETTLVHWGGEIGRLPVTENHGDPNACGRDHNGQGFSMWLAGGGIKGGMTWGETDPLGHSAVVNRVTANDYQATLLHLFGFDHAKLSFLHNSRLQTLTDQRECRVVNEIIS
ncbi:MAG TPA: DUF1501 domain-containing protein [Planctomycetaceae bacterium]|jgi:hypothetical protein|nr:DUF1501 domain-containing protein [Planctomycetaceae bacterium]